MKSQNFENLRAKWPELADLGGFAESYAHADPVGSISKLRIFCEQAVDWLYYDQRINRPFRPSFLDLLENLEFREVVPPLVLSKFHAVRKEGNKSLHTNEGTTETAEELLREAHNIGRWLFVAHGAGSIDQCADFVKPARGGVEGVESRREKRAYLERIAKQETQLRQLLADRESERSRAKQTLATESERKSSLQAALKAQQEIAAIDPLSFNEAQTRTHFIDKMLADAGWDVGNTDQVVKERRVQYQPETSAPSGEGRADYVLLDDNGRALGVIEAKKTSEDSRLGRTRAKEYADGIERETGHRPVIFHTNGYDLWIWDDAAGYPPRQLYGMYSKDSLQRLVFQRTARKPLKEVKCNKKITDRMYQIEAVRRVCEKFAQKFLKALIVLATGTGKTRVAISLCDVLIRAGWVKRVLFLCDRKELRRQAADAFKDFLPSEPQTIVTRATANDRSHSIYLGTYPAMMSVYETFDVGFFDLIIADESHRSLYNRYREMFRYFDSFQVGLTATPVEYADRDTYRIFECEDSDPTATFSYQEAVCSTPAYVVPFQVNTFTTKFLRDGIKYSEMTDEQKRQYDQGEDVPALREWDKKHVDKVIYNKDTSRHILRNLMENGIKLNEGTRLGKTIIFARNIQHARLLEATFNELYPQYGGTFCQTIVSEDPGAESLIADFKGIGNNPDLTIAISVDMLNTGVDIEEIVNLVFAKPVKTATTLWQMIGRGTRLCKDLLGPGKDKEYFQIFDHWGCLELLNEEVQAAEPSRSRSLAESVFLARVELARAARDAEDDEGFELAIDLLSKDINALPRQTIAIRERRRELDSVEAAEVLNDFLPETAVTLEMEIAPLMQWLNIYSQKDAWQFDRLITRAQAELIRGSSTFDDRWSEIIVVVHRLADNRHLTQVRAKQPVLDRITSPGFREQITVNQLEEIRQELRGVIKYRSQGQPVGTYVFDIEEDPSQIEQSQTQISFENLPIGQLAYENRVNNVLQSVIDESETLQKIKRQETVTEDELEGLCSLVLTREPGLNLHDLEEYHPETHGLDRILRSIVGLNAKIVQKRFERFVQEYNPSGDAIKFLELLKNHIAKYGSIEVGKLYEAPFTALHSDGPDGLFEEQQVDELIDILDSFSVK